jgi:hypothetical protein
LDVEFSGAKRSMTVRRIICFGAALQSATVAVDCLLSLNPTWRNQGDALRPFGLALG